MHVLSWGDRSHLSADDWRLRGKLWGGRDTFGTGEDVLGGVI